MKPERFTAGVFVIVIAGMMVSSLGSFASGKVKHVADNTRREIAIDWEKLYPFDGRRESAAREKISSFCQYVKGKLEDYTSKKLPGYYTLVETAKKYEDALSWNMVSMSEYNAVMRLKDDCLTTYTMSLDVAHDAESVKGLAGFCGERGIDFVYINLPTKVCVSEDKEISGILDFSNQNTDRLLAMLKESGVRCYDFREALHSAGMDHHESFFITDHHWKPETGLWAAGKVLEILRDDFGYDVDPEILRPENFRYEVYPDWFLGSQGKKVTLARTKPEDFTMIYPKFGTALKFDVPGLGLKLSGDFGITYNMNQVETKDYYGKNPYAAYIYADNPLMRMENMNVSNGRRLLIIHESMSNCVVPFAALGVQYVDSIDLRQFTGSVRNFVDTVRPDAVIVMYYSTIPGRYANPLSAWEAKRMYSFQ
ncbi:MAG: hypothetical protein IJR63_00595 [Synergistaceae bacterium]|nr:hypothetical protein [Synergistaceae bacterium]